MEPLTKASTNKDDSHHSNSQPVEYIYEAELLLAYVAQNGLEIDDAIVTVIVNSKYWLEQGEWTAEREIQFWMAFNTIAKRVSPVSVASLKATSSTAVESRMLRNSRQRFNLYWSPKGNTFAKQTVSLYQKSTVWVLLILLLTHSYWLSESMLIAPILELRQQIGKTQEQLLTLARQNSTITQLADDPRISEYQAKLKDYENLFQAHSKMVKTCKPLLSLFIACSMSPEEATTDKEPNQYRPNRLATPESVLELEALLQQKKFILANLQLFVLPLFYGLLGAFVYVLRTLTIEIKTLTYTRESNISYRLRIQLGALAGLAIGWITGSNASFSLDTLSPDALSSFTSGGLSLQTLSPMALAFIAGYSVDLLFALMDRIIYTFSTKESTSLNTFKPGSVINQTTDSLKTFKSSSTINQAATDK
jgi:hypothetical protein